MARDFYQVLGLARTADEKEIKKAYRKLARQYHPDVNPNDKTAESKFKEVNEAFQVLSDKDKRTLYDQFGADYDKVGSAPPGAGGYAGGYPGAGGNVNFNGSNINFENLEELFNQPRRGGAYGSYSPPGSPADDGGGFGDLFENILGGRGRGRKRGPQKGQDSEQPVHISLAESLKGTQVTLRFTDASRADKREFTVKIPAGVREGAKVRVAGKGGVGENGGPAGDLFLIVHITPHQHWKREGDDLLVEVPVTFAEAALGATIEVPALNGPLQIRVPAGTQSGQKIRLSGRGAPKTKGGAGDQYVTIKVTVPKELSERERELIQELASLRSENPRRDLPGSIL